MPRLRKIVLNGTVVFVTLSIEQGLLLKPNPLVKAILRSCLARAQTQHPVTICHYLVEDTHIHMVIAVENPSDLSGFMCRFKTESAHAINSLLGRKKRTVWCEGYDSPILGTLEDAINKIVYLYSNPSKDNLEDSIDLYPGLSTWQEFNTGPSFSWQPQYRRPQFKKLPRDRKCNSMGEAVVAELNREVDCWNFLEIKCDAWMSCYGVSDPEERDRINNEIILRLREEESHHRRMRKEKGTSVIGRRRLKESAFDTEYLPNRTGKRTWVVCHDRTFRRSVIAFFKDLSEIAREVYQLWKEGDFSRLFPPGLFPPSMPKLAEFAPACLVLSW